MATLQELEGYLAQARSAYHRIISGSQAQTVREADGSTVVYQLAQAKDLAFYISTLESQIAAAQGGSISGAVRRPILVSF
jgi:hypothetical protein